MGLKEGGCYLGKLYALHRHVLTPVSASLQLDLVNDICSIVFLGDLWGSSPMDSRPVGLMVVCDSPFWIRDNIPPHSQGADSRAETTAINHHIRACTIKGADWLKHLLQEGSITSMEGVWALQQANFPVLLPMLVPLLCSTPEVSFLIWVFPEDT